MASRYWFVPGIPPGIGRRPTEQIVGAIGLVCTGWLAISGCSHSSESPHKPPVPAVVAVQPIKMPIVEWDEYVGRLTALNRVEIRARVSGYLATTHFEEGQIVQSGDILMVIDQRPFLAEVSRNEANVAAAQALVAQATSAAAQARAEKQRADIRHDLAKRNRNRANTLREQNAISLEEHDVRQSDLEQAESDVAVAAIRIESAEAAIVAAKAAVGVAKANLDLANLELQYTEIRAPISGRISNFYVTNGNLVSGGTNDSTLLTTIVSIDPIHCYFDTDEQAFLKYVRLSRDSEHASIRDVKIPVYVALVDEREGFPRRGHTDFLDNRLDDQTGTIRARAVLPNTNHELTPGLFARVRLPGSPRYEAVLIPDRAVGTDLAEKFVLVVDEQNKVRRQSVTLGPISHGLRVVRTGLTGSEMVILSGQQKARPGGEVSVTRETLVPGEESLPDEYEPVPEDEWLTPPRQQAGTSVVAPVEPAIAGGTLP